MNFVPFPIYPGHTAHVNGTPKGVVRDSMTGALFVLVETPGPMTQILVSPAGTDLPNGSRFVGGVLADGTLFVVTAGPTP